FAERQAMEVEREVIDLYRAFYLRDRIGDVLEGTISGVMGFGFFVVIDEPFVEGLVRLEALSDDYYIFDEPACRLVGRRSGRTFALGDAIRVEVQSVSVVRRKVDFALVNNTLGPSKGPRPPAKGSRERSSREPTRHARRRQQPSDHQKADRKRNKKGGGKRRR